MSQRREVLTGLGILCGTVAAVAAVTFIITTLVVPPSATSEPTPTPEPTFDIAVAPQVAGGDLQVDGDRTGTLVLDEARGFGGAYEVREDGGVMLVPAEDVVLQGPDGRVRFERGSGEVTLIDYDGLSFYPQPEDCRVTLGAVNEANGLMAGLVECPQLTDIRGGGTVSMTGVVALPADVLQGRGDIPQSGGSVGVDGSTLVFTEAEIFLDERVSPEHERIQSAIFTPDFLSVLHLEYDVDADQFFLAAISVDEEYALLSEPCPIPAEELGRFNETTKAIRLAFDCSRVEVPGGGTGSVTGTIVADVIEGLIDRGPDAP